MAWSAAKEEELRQARRNGGWRWIGYIGVAGGLVFTIAMWAEYISLRADGAEPNVAALFAIPVIILVLGFVVALPAEKAAKQARILKAEKADSDLRV